MEPLPICTAKLKGFWDHCSNEPSITRDSTSGIILFLIVIGY